MADQFRSAPGAILLRPNCVVWDCRKRRRAAPLLAAAQRTQFGEEMTAHRVVGDALAVNPDV
jgi:hypothetical protein